MSLSWAEFLSYWGNWTLVAALLVGVGATYAVVVSGNVKEAALKRDVAASAERTATLEKEAAALKAANLNLEALIAPRSLSIEQQESLASALKPYSGMSVVISSPPMDGEALGIAQQILAALDAAGIKSVNMIGRIGSAAGFAFGVHMVGREGDKRNELLLRTLHDKLTSFGQLVDADKENAAIPLLTYPGADFPDAKIAAVALFIGTKPIPTIGK